MVPMTMQEVAGLFERLPVPAFGLGLRFFKGFEVRPGFALSKPSDADGMGQQTCQQFSESQHRPRRKKSLNEKTTSLRRGASVRSALKFCRPKATSSALRT